MIEFLMNRLVDTQNITCPADPLNEKNDKATPTMAPLQSLAVLKRALKEDDFALRFDFMSLNWRCIKLLRSIQKICTEQSPLDYPRKKWGTDYDINGFISHMFAGVAGRTRAADPLPEACMLVHTVIAKEGNAEYLKEEARMGIKKGTSVNPHIDPEVLEDPVRNFIPYPLRKNMQQYSEEDMARFKSRGEHVLMYV